MPSHRDQARLESWDRNPVETGWDVEIQPAPMPTTDTTLASYTVPTARKASLDGAYLSVFVLAAGGGADNLNMRLVVNRFTTALGLLRLKLSPGTVGNSSHADVGFGGWLQAADALYATYSGSGAGLSAVFDAGAKCTECDA